MKKFVFCWVLWGGVYWSICPGVRLSIFLSKNLFFKDSMEIADENLLEFSKFSHSTPNLKKCKNPQKLTENL
jgi:hypothetical protein